jgi:hypothetical protein
MEAIYNAHLPSGNKERTQKKPAIAIILVMILLGYVL